MAYPIMDLLLFGVAVRLAVDRGKRPPAFYLMAGSVAVLFTTDTIYTLILLHGVVRQHHRPPRARMGTLLPVVGRGRAAQVDGRTWTSPRPRATSNTRADDWPCSRAPR